MSLIYKTEDLKRAERYDYWDDALHEVCGDFSTATDSKEDFTGVIEVRNVAGLDFASISSNADKISRSRLQVATSNDEYCFLITQVSGRSCMAQNGQETVLEPGDMTIIESGRPSVFQFDGCFSNLSLHLPRKLLENRLRHHNIPCATGLRGSVGMGSVVNNFLMSLYDQAGSFSEAQSESVRETLLELIASALSPDDKRSGHDRLPPHKVAQLNHIQQFIETRLPDPDLSPARIADEYGISTRHLYRVFGAAGCSVSEWIRKRRLDKCREDLADPKFAGHGIIQIAFHWGFNDASHFSRSFKAEFGVSPREFRLREALDRKLQDA